MNYRVNDLVEVRSKEEILRTLDHQGRLEGLPFMPQMFQFCGQRFPVYQSAHKTCDTVTFTGGRRVTDCVHLSTRCDGTAYGNCQAACLLFWKTAWLKRVDGAGESPTPKSGGCTEAELLAGTLQDCSTTEDVRYSCQATELPNFSTPLPWSDFSQYQEDYTSGNASLGRILRGAVYWGFYWVMNLGIGVGRPMRWGYDRFQGLIGGFPFPRRRGLVPQGHPTPTAELNLQPGEWVRVKPYPDILATLDGANKNRGLYLDAEAVPFCNKIYQVKLRINTFIDEQTGRLIKAKTDSIVLENAWCQSRYSDRRMFCPRSIYLWWREIWLERVTPTEADVAQNAVERGQESKDDDRRPLFTDTDFTLCPSLGTCRKLSY